MGFALSCVAHMLIWARDGVRVIMAPRSDPFITLQAAERHMPSLIRFLFIIALGAGAVAGGLYVLSDYFEPEQKETRSTVSGVKVRR